MLTNCSSSKPVLTAEPDVIATKLNEKFQTLARVGNVPIDLDTREGIIRYSLKPKNKQPVFLIIFSPSSVDGELKVPFLSKDKNGKPADGKENLNYSESTFEYNRYIDLMLRAHRHILRGELDQAKFALDQARNDYDETYASLVLRGTISLAENDMTSAATYFSSADRLFPKKEISKLVGEKK